MQIIYSSLCPALGLALMVRFTLPNNVLQLYKLSSTQLGVSSLLDLLLCDTVAERLCCNLLSYVCWLQKASAFYGCCLKGKEK